jgi:protein-tyrosine phosphatase
VHCKAGADRTGMLTAIILDALGVDRDSIVQDYGSYTDANGQSVTDPPSPITMIDRLAYLDEAHGGTVAYLRSAGLPTEIRDRLIEPFTTP